MMSPTTTAEMMSMASAQPGTVIHSLPDKWDLDPMTRFFLLVAMAQEVEKGDIWREYPLMASRRPVNLNALPKADKNVALAVIWHAPSIDVHGVFFLAGEEDAYDRATQQFTPWFRVGGLRSSADAEAFVRRCFGRIGELRAEHCPAQPED